MHQQVPHFPLKPRFPGHVPGEIGVWLLIAGDMLAFTLFFCTFAFYRQQQIAIFEASRLHLNIYCGVANTLLMLTSSWFVATALRVVRQGRVGLAASLFGGGFVCGILFGVTKCFEYGQKFQAGITPLTNDFFMFYYLFTGIHCLHVLIAMAVLVFLIRHVRGGKLDAVRMRNIESGSSFWHLVDLLWIVLFGLLYLLP